MNTEETQQQALQIRPERLLAFVHAMLDVNSGRPNDEEPLPPGPWDPSVRAALKEASVFGPRPEPWRVLAGVLAKKYPELWDVIVGGHNIGDEVALNPQPLPPRFAFLASLAQTVVSRAELLQEIADMAQGEGERQGIIIVSGYISRFADDFCGTGFRLRYPFPGPRPTWFSNELDGVDLVIMAAHFDQSAKEAFSPNLRRSLTDASAKLLEAGFSKMQ